MTTLSVWAKTFRLSILIFDFSLVGSTQLVMHGVCSGDEK